jgi:hypothetical protein
MKLYNVVGIDDLEDLTFARCTSMAKAERAKTMLEDEGFECMVRIIQDNIEVDVVEIDGKLIVLD